MSCSSAVSINAAKLPPEPPPAADRDVHEPWVAGVEVLVAEPVPVERPQRHVLDEHVGALEQAMEHLPPGLVLDVQSDPALAAVVDRVRQALRGEERRRQPP